MNSLAVYFSPTRTGDKIIHAIGRGIGERVTYTEIRKWDEDQEIETKDYDIILLVAPIYEERIPNKILEKFQKLDLAGKKVIGVSVYGNIGYGISMFQYQKLTEGKADLVALAACVGEHTYAEENVRVAYGRPEEQDLQDAVKFGEKIRQCYYDGTLIPIKRNLWPGFFAFLISYFPETGIKRITKSPELDREKCNQCMACSAICPMGAIDKNTLLIDERKCIRCYACVKRCEKKARSGGIRYAVLKKIFYRTGKKRKENLFIMKKMKWNN